MTHNLISRHKQYQLAICSVAFLAASPLFACTLWGIAGDQSVEGTLIVKNRDWAPNHQQSLRLQTPSTGYRYLGLFANDGAYKGIKAGVNERGLVVVSASASSLARSVREADQERHGVMRAILQYYATLDEISAHADDVFPKAKPVFLLLADKTGLLQVEIGRQGKYRLQRVNQGAIAHTNHYLHESILDLPQQIGASSATRLARIQHLLAKHNQRWQLEDFTEISRDKNAGPENSLWRLGREHTLASWQMALPMQGAARLHLILANPNQSEQILDLILDNKFWLGKDGVVAH